MILALARHIFEYGVDGRFYTQVRKYHHEDGKVYWSMDITPEETALINRCDETQTYEARRTAGTLPRSLLGSDLVTGIPRSSFLAAGLEGPKRKPEDKLLERGDE